MRFLGAATAALVLSACAGIVPRVDPAVAAVLPMLRVEPTITAEPRTMPPVAPTTPAAANARAAGIAPGPEVATLAISGESAARALTAFRASCPALLRRPDTSGLVRPADWAGPCSVAATTKDARAFFDTNFETIRVGAGTAFATGYYEPEIAGSRIRDAAHAVPIYAKPDDLAEIELGAFAESLKGKTIRGRYVGGSFIPYADRAAIEDGALAGRVREIAWAADPIEFFFLQIQGSGRLRLPDGSVMRIGYASQNGRDYVGIGALLRDRGALVSGQLSMQGVMAWLRANPDAGRAVMRENKSWVFFREITGPGPIGSLNIPVVARASVATDPAFVPLGAPIWLDLDRSEADGLWIAQDTGGAIKGANRVDTFWGAGDDARRIAGGMSGRGVALILVPRGTAMRLGLRSSDVARPQP